MQRWSPVGLGISPQQGGLRVASSHEFVAPASLITLKVLDLRAHTPLPISSRRLNVKATSPWTSWSLNWPRGPKGAQISARLAGRKACHLDLDWTAAKELGKDSKRNQALCLLVQPNRRSLCAISRN